MKRKILIVEDDNRIAEILKKYLEEAYFKVFILKNGDNVINNVQDSEPDLILLDIMLPGKDGIAICSEIRSFSKVPIIFITAKINANDRLRGLETGADDYICKPFDPKEVVARVLAVLRRTNKEDENKEIVLGSLVMDIEKHTVTIGGSNIDLTPIEFQMLEIMMSNPDRLFTRYDFISRIQGYDYEGYDRTIDNHIKNLRKKINICLPSQEIIKTIYGLGYKIHMHENE